MKKKIISLCLVVALALTAIGGATLAYFTDDSQKSNNFTIGDIDIAVNEKGYIWDPTEKAYIVRPMETTDEDKGFTFENLMPTYIVSKRPTVENRTANAAYVRVAIVINNLDATTKAIDQSYEGATIQDVYSNVFAGWGLKFSEDDNGSTRVWMEKNGYYAIDTASKVSSDDAVSYQADQGNTFTDANHYADALKGDDRVYVLYFKLDGNTTSEELFGGLNVPADFDNDQMEMFSGLNIGIYADAIQTVGFKDYNGVPAWRQAFDTLQNEHPLGWWNTSDTPTT